MLKTQHLTITRAEILDAYCRTLLLSRSLGETQLLTNVQVRELLEAKKRWGLHDPRSDPEYQDADLSQRPLFDDSENVS